jgi:hypothetical protein
MHLTKRLKGMHPQIRIKRRVCNKHMLRNAIKEQAVRIRAQNMSINGLKEIQLNTCLYGVHVRMRLYEMHL